ncbi:phosphotransferase family protein [Frankia sp. AiPs1]|uniref:phosphotransferase family protein n=1 Tax=Frankia sp. AiPs1 TaxID=573493 RepID=UPI0020442395|nr:phosphotransferase family protein [Frankia sp. AiPs1]MCM3921882.1 phosphotransferase family protein [Frankia sp. AiPs1]
MSQDEQVRAWLEREFDGTIVSFERQERWRAAWFADLTSDGELHRYYVRGHRGGKFREMITLGQEADINRVLHHHGVPVPRVHGMIDDPPAIVMDRLPGRVNLATALDDGERDAVLDQYVDAMCRMHAIDVGEFGALGLPVPADNRAAALNMYATGERNYRRAKTAPSPMIEFMWRWLRRNVPTGRTRRALIQGDAAQFLFDGGRMTGLIDFEAAYIGDPIAEFAAMRSRDCEEPLGDIGRIARRYEAVTGERIDRDAVEFHTAGWSLMTPFQWEDSVRNPAAGDSWLEYFTWLVGCGRWALEAIAAVTRAPLSTVEPPAQRRSSYSSAAYTNLMALLDEWPTASAYEGFRADSARAVTRFAEHVHAFGADLEGADVEEISELLGARQPDLATAEAALEEFVLRASPDFDVPLVQYFHRWTQRQQFLIAGTGARHEKLIHLSLQPLTGDAWPAGGQPLRRYA